jgi:FkbM family methyltransferase
MRYRPRFRGHRDGARLDVAAPGRPPEPAPVAAKPGTPVLDHEQVLQALLKLTPHKQTRVIEKWPGVSGHTPEGLKVTARSAKELRRFTNPKDEGMLEWVRDFAPEDVFYDIGANVGGVTMTVAGLHPGIRMVAIEPSFGSFESLARNLSLNGLLGSTIPLQIALLDQTGLQPLHYRSTAAGTSLHAVGEALDHLGEPFTPVEVQLIPTFRLDDLVETLKLPAPTVVKIDVDGYEEPVLRGAERTLRAGTIRELNIEIVDHDRAGTRLATITALLESCGYGLVRTFQHDREDSYVADYLYSRSGPLDMAAARPFAEVAPVRPAPPAAEDGSGKIEALREKVRGLRERNDALKEKNDRLARQSRQLVEEVAELRSSYYLSGARKKVDLRELPGFSEVARRVMDEGLSGMNYDRLYTLWQAVRGARAELPVIEVGAYKGGSARFINETLRHDGRSPRFYVCDTFAGHPRTSEIDTGHHQAGKFEDTSAETVAAYLGGDANIELVVGDIVATSERFADESFAFVHLDVDLYEGTDFCLRFFTPRLAGDGVIVVDDYGVVTCPGVQKAVDEFVAESPDFRMFHLLSGQAVIFRVS